MSADELELADLHSRGVEATEAIAAPLEPAGDPLGVVALAVAGDRRLGVHPGLLQSVARLAGASSRTAPARADVRRGSARPADRAGEPPRVPRAPRVGAAPNRRPRRPSDARPRRPRRLQDRQRHRRPSRRRRRPPASWRGTLAEQSRSRERPFRGRRRRVRAGRRGRLRGRDARRRPNPRQRRRRPDGLGGVATFPVDALTRTSSCTRRTSRCTRRSVRGRTRRSASRRRARRGRAAGVGGALRGSARADGVEAVRADVLSALATVTGAVRSLGRETSLEAMPRGGAPSDGDRGRHGRASAHGWTTARSRRRPCTRRRPGVRQQRRLPARRLSGHRGGPGERRAADGLARRRDRGRGRRSRSGTSECAPC